jgi:hypothetical protein
MVRTSARGAALDKVLTAASKSGNVEAAIKRHGTGLSKADVDVLTSLSSADLKQLGNLRKKLGPLGAVAADNNGGIF